jgi:hypothetical protein
MAHLQRNGLVSLRNTEFNASDDETDTSNVLGVTAGRSMKKRGRIAHRA